MLCYAQKAYLCSVAYLLLPVDHRPITLFNLMKCKQVCMKVHYLYLHN